MMQLYFFMPSVVHLKEIEYLQSMVHEINLHLLAIGNRPIRLSTVKWRFENESALTFYLTTKYFESRYYFTKRNEFL